MKTVELKTWNEFRDEIEELETYYGINTTRNIILYRGQSDRCWRLQTTLERFSSGVWTIRGYAQLAIICAPQIESYTEKEWKLPKPSEIEKDLTETFNDTLVKIPMFEFGIYLRHYGFPSPLLDWCMSPYVAAFFAFCERTTAENVAIFAYIDSEEGVKSGFVGEPQITTRGPYIRAHKRHFLQQSCYTIATKVLSERMDHEFVCHEDVFKQNRQDQDILIKYVIPSSERITALKYLERVNINHFSLMQSEEALMKTLAFKEIELRNI